MSYRADITIIGAGVIGLAIASQVTGKGREVYLLEKNETFGQEQSSRNSEVIHAGIYYEKDSLKAKMCLKGNSLLYELCERNGIAYKKCGKIVVATSVVEVAKLEKLYRQGQDNGAPLKMLSLLAIPILSGSIVGTVSRGKEKILIYRKSPSGMEKFMMTRFLQGCLVAVPVAATMIGVSTMLVPQFTITHLIANIVWASLRAAASVTFVLGSAFLIPVFSEESRTRATGIMINLQVAMALTVGLEIGTSELGLRPSRILPNLDNFTGLLCDHLVLTLIFFSLGTVLLMLGRVKLNRIE